ncbi:MAG: response regulator, partial [Candidatus Omnitrophica bacterium]|nr:response regulator [Candidatus Omnitrophota bacterium]
FINSEAERLTGWSSAQAAGQALPIVFRIVNEETRHIVENPVEKVLRSGATVGLANHTILIKRDGSEIPIDDSAAPIRLSNGQIFGVVLIFRDFTDHKNAEHSLKQLNRELNDLTAHLEKRVEERTKQLEEQAGLLRQLAVELTEVEEEERKRLAQLLHDHLQQLLIAIKIRLELMRKSENLDKTAVAEMSSFVEEAYQSSRTLTAELRPPVLYESGLGAALRFLARKFEKDQKLKIHLSIFADAEPVSDIFKVMIYQSVQEALLNIVKYAGITECSLVMEKVEEKRIHIIVSDKGKGFDPKIIGLKGAGGFGLFSIRERIKALGGECKIISAVGEGTSLEMILPAETKILEPQAVEISQSPILLNKDKERISVLVADDHKIVRQSLARALSLESFIDEVFEASNGKEAVRMVQERRPNVVIMDFNMPEMNGLEATRILHKQYPHIKIIGLSVQAEEEMIQMMREAGAVRFFNKNEDMEVLMKTLKSLL